MPSETRVAKCHLYSARSKTDFCAAATSSISPSNHVRSFPLSTHFLLAADRTACRFSLVDTHAVDWQPRSRFPTRSSYLNSSSKGEVAPVLTYLYIYDIYLRFNIERAGDRLDQSACPTLGPHARRPFSREGTPRKSARV